MVCPFDPGGDRQAELLACEPPLTVQDVFLQQREEGFHRGVVRARADPAPRAGQSVVPERFDEAAGPELGTPVRMHHRPGRAACPHGVLQCRDGKRGLHPRVHRVADDPGGIDVLDRAQLELPLGSGVLRDVGQPELVWRLGGEVPLHQVIVDRWSRLPVQTTFLRKHRPDAVVPAQTLHPVLSRRDALLRKLIGDEPVPERRIVGMDVQRRVDQVGIRPVPFRHRAGSPPVVPLLAELQHPAGHRHGNSLGGKIRDQRVDHFGLMSLAR